MCLYFKIHYANILLLADNVKIVSVLKSVEAKNYQEMTERARV